MIYFLSSSYSLFVCTFIKSCDAKKPHVHLYIATKPTNYSSFYLTTLPLFLTFLLSFSNYTTEQMETEKKTRLKGDNE